MKKTAIKILAVASVFAASLVFMGCPSSPTDVDPVENEEPSNNEPSQNDPSNKNPSENVPSEKDPSDNVTYSTLSIYGAETNDFTLGGTENWYAGPTFTDAEGVLTVAYGTAGGSGCYTCNVGILAGDTISVEYKADAASTLRFVTNAQEGKKECDVEAPVAEDFTTVSYTFKAAEAGNMIQIGFIAGDATGTMTVKSITLKAVDKNDGLKAAIDEAKAVRTAAVIGTEAGNYPQESADTLDAAIAVAEAELAAKTTRKDWVAAQATLGAAVEAFNTAVVKITLPTFPAKPKSGTLIYASTDSENSQIKNINPNWGQSSTQGYEEMSDGTETRSVIVLNLVDYQGMELSPVDISSATKLCFEYCTKDASASINVYPIYTQKAEDPKEYAIAWVPITDGQWHKAEITFDKNNAANADFIDQIKFAGGKGKIYYDNLRVE